MDFVLIGVNVLLLMALWRFMLKRSILDTHRDRLFDLRDELRAAFVSHGWSLEEPIYRRLRDLINGYLRFTESYSFGEFMYLEHRVRSNEKLTRGLKTQIAAKFSTATQEQQEFVSEFRQKAVRAMMDYMIVSSGTLMVLVIVLTPFVVLWSIISTSYGMLRAGGFAIFGKAVEVRELLGALAQLTVAAIANKLWYEDFVEEYSYRQAF